MSKPKHQTLLKLFLSCFIAIVFLCFHANAQRKYEKSAAELAALKKLIAAVEVNPENIKAHEAFINALKRGDPFLVSQYKLWMKRFPKSSIVPFAAGKELARAEYPQAKEFLLKAVELDPSLAEAWYLLSIDAQRWGDYTLHHQYLAKAVKADPKSADYTFYYAMSFKNIDTAKYDSLLLNTAWKFSGSERGAQALYWMADKTDNPVEKKAYYEQLYKRYINTGASWSSGGISRYFDMLINSDAAKAFELALSMSMEAKTNRLSWVHKRITAKDFMNAEQLLASGRPQEAERLLDRIQLRSNWHVSYIDAAEKLLFLKAQVYDEAKNTQAAYDSLALYYSAKPSDTIRNVLLMYAAKLGRNEGQVNDDIWKLRDAKAEPASDLTLGQYLSKDSISLTDYRGKVVLLTFWFPGCGPCRAEFPHLEAVVKKFSKDKLAYLGINGISEQDEYVIPFIKSTGYSFIPLQGKSWYNGNLKAVGYPANYLIDQDGRIVFSKFLINKDNERMLELMISDLINRKNNKGEMIK